MDVVRATASLSQHQALHNGDAFNYDQFDDHPFSYPYLISNLDSSSSSSAVESPSLAQPGAVSSLSPPSRRSSRTSWETSWFDDDDGDKLADVDPSGIDQCEMGDFDDDFEYDDDEYEIRDDSVLAGDDNGVSFDQSEWFRQYSGQLDVSDNPPTPEILNTAGEIPVYDSAGGARPFKSLFAQGDVVGDRQLIIFIRFFYCGACRAYLQSLMETVNAQTYYDMPTPTSIIIIGCGQPELIRNYKAITQCPFPIFADPTRKLFKTLGMKVTFNAIGPRRPEYMKHIGKREWVNEQISEWTAAGSRRWKGGSILQVGGEFLFQDGKVVWCHRMRNYRDHAEMETIKRVLDIDR